jgi:hypothetical protein
MMGFAALYPSYGISRQRHHLRCREWLRFAFQAASPPKMSRLLPHCRFRPPLAAKFGELIDDLAKKAGRQKSVIESLQRAGYPGEVEARPGEHVELVKNDSGAIAVQAEVLFDRQRDFDGHRRVARRRMGDGRNGDRRTAAGLTLHRQDDSARSHLAPLDEAFGRFTSPKIRIGDDKPDFGLWQHRYGFRWRVFELLVK